MCGLDPRVLDSSIYPGEDMPFPNLTSSGNSVPTHTPVAARVSLRSLHIFIPVDKASR